MYMYMYTPATAKSSGYMYVCMYESNVMYTRKTEQYVIPFFRRSSFKTIRNLNSSSVSETFCTCATDHIVVQLTTLILCEILMF
jgi:hypothetical protein